MRQPPAASRKATRRRRAGAGQIRDVIGNCRLGLIILIAASATLAFAAVWIAEAVRNGWCWACG